MRYLSMRMEALWLFILLPVTSSAFAPQRPLTLVRQHLLPTTYSSRLWSARAEPEAVSKTVVQSSETTIPESTKFRRLKDLMWSRETQEDLTAAEFACSIDAKPDIKKKRAIDYDNLLQQLDRRILDLCCEDARECKVSAADPVLTRDKGMGTIAYTEPQRQSLLKRVVKTRAALMETMKGHITEETEEPFSISLPKIEIELLKENDDPTAPGPKLYVRDDGTVDWDGALQDRAALSNFGTAVWARINGQNPEEVSEDYSVETMEEHDAPKPVTVKIEETEAIRREKATLDALMQELGEMETAHTVLLQSALKAGQAVANINLATLDPSLRNKIRQSADRLELKSEEVSYHTLIYELERIYTYLAGELGNPNSKGYIPLQDRLNVAEFGLLESQVDSFKRLLEVGEGVDADVQKVVSDEVQDFKRRLGIDYYVTGVTFDQEAIARWIKDLLLQMKKGVAFYVKGCELFWNDIVFGLTLIGRALQGYTLKPREVRNLRRTFKDIITFIPVVIILIIPLSPVGHVMVFGAIQRFFPDFFPSCFTERRQNLLQLYESTEYTEVVINESWNDKLTRLASAVGFFLMSAFRNVVTKSNDVMEGKGLLNGEEHGKEDGFVRNHQNGFFNRSKQNGDKDNVNGKR